MEFSDDPTADFLAREQAILGDDAALFGNTLVSQPLAAVPAQPPTGSTPTQNIAAEFEDALFASAPAPETITFVLSFEID
jgi:hypothetical protein